MGFHLEHWSEHCLMLLVKQLNNYRLGDNKKILWIQGKLQCIMGSYDPWEFPPFSKGHLQFLATAQMAGKLPAIWAVQGDC